MGEPEHIERKNSLLMDSLDPLVTGLVEQLVLPLLGLLVLGAWHEVHNLLLRISQGH